MKELDNGRSKLDPNFQFTGSNAVSVLDAGHALGVVAGMIATKRVTELAAEFGIGAVAVRNSNHFGAASIYTIAMAKQGMLGMSFSNSDALVVPFQGKLPFFGTNPISVAASGVNEDLFCVDMSTSQSSFSKVQQGGTLQQALQPNILVDADGNDASITGGAPTALMPLGGYKGQCLGMIVELLCTLLSGGPFDHELQNLYKPPFDEPRRMSHFFIAINTASFLAAEEFQSRLSELSGMLRSQETFSGGNVSVPGDLEKYTEIERTRDGIPLDDRNYEYLVELESELGLEN